MTHREYRKRLEEMTNEEFEKFTKDFGGDHPTRESYVQWFIHNPNHEALICDILGMQTEDEKRNAPAATIIQNIHGNQVVAAHSIHGGVSINLTFVQILEQVQKQIEQDSTIPEQEKKPLLDKIKDLAANSYVANIVTSAAWDGAKQLWALGKDALV